MPSRLSCGSARSRQSFVFDPRQSPLGGDSAGGTVAALASIRLSREMPLVLPDVLAMCYANTDLAGDYRSRTERGTASASISRSDLARSTGDVGVPVRGPRRASRVYGTALTPSVDRVAAVRFGQVP